MRSRSAVIVGSAWLLAMLGAVPTGAQQPAAYRSRLEGRLDSRTLPAVARVVDSAFAAGIPAEPLVDRALEGASKGVASDAIVRAVRKLAGELATARGALGVGSPTAELYAGAIALQRGVEPASLARLRHDRPGQPLAVPLGVLSGLIASGVPVTTATTTILDLTKNGLADEQLVAFRREVERAVGMGAAPAAAVLVNQGELSFGLSRDPSSGLPVGTGSAGSARPGKQRP